MPQPKALVAILAVAIGVFAGIGAVTFVYAEGASYLSTDPADLIRTPTQPNEVHLYKSTNHHQDWLDCIRTRKQPVADVEIGARTVSVCHLGNICYLLKRKLQWDPAKEVFIGDDEANRLLDRPKRAPWRL